MYELTLRLQLQMKDSNASFYLFVYILKNPIFLMEQGANKVITPEI